MPETPRSQNSVLCWHTGIEGLHQIVKEQTQKKLAAKNHFLDPKTAICPNYNVTSSLRFGINATLTTQIRPVQGPHIFPVGKSKKINIVQDHKNINMLEI